MSDLEKVSSNDMNIVDIATHQPKRVDESTRAFKGMEQDEWYEIVQWLQLRMDDASKWSMTKIDVMYTDLKNYTKGDVFYAIQKLYEEGRTRAPDGGMILAKLKALDIPKVRNTTNTVPTAKTTSKHDPKCNEPGYSCLFVDSTWFSDEYGNYHFEQLCTADGTKGICEARKPAVPNEHELRTKPKKETKGNLYRTMSKMKIMNDDTKRKVWKEFEKYADGDLEEAIKEYGKQKWYE